MGNFFCPAFRGVTLACVAGLLGACGNDPSPLEPGRVTAAVIGGTPSPADHDSVVMLRVEGQNGTWNDCTATSLSERVVATAKHCVSVVQPSFVCRGNGDLVQDGTGAGLFGQIADPAMIAVYVGVTPSGAPAAHGLKVVATSSLDACHDDVAMVVLDRPLALAREVPLRWSLPTRVGEKVTLVGYGVGDGSDGIGRREIGEVRIVDVGPAEGSTAADAITTPPRTFVVPGATVCYGDSGGPALSVETGALVGMYSRISGDCLAPESRNTYMLASGYRTLAEQALAVTGEPLSLEQAAGDGCAEADCAAAPVDASPSPDLPTTGDSRSEFAPRGAFKCATSRPYHRPRPSTLWWLGALAAAALNRRVHGRDACADGRSRSVPAD